MIYKYMKENRDYNRKLKNCFHCRLGCDANTRCEILIKLREKYSEGEEEAFAKELTETKCDGPKGGFEKLKLPDGKLFAIVNGYVRKTNKIEADLPRSFVKLMSPSNIEQFVQAKGVVDIQYHWVKENHVFKDSCIFVSYTNKFDEDDFTGTKEKYANAVSYTNKSDKNDFISNYDKSELQIFDDDIFTFLSAAKHYSNFDVSKVLDELKAQLNWLSKNEKDTYLSSGIDKDKIDEWFYQNFSNINLF